MNRKNIAGVVAIVVIASIVMFSGCIEDKTPTSTSAPTPTTSIPTVQGRLLWDEKPLQGAEVRLNLLPEGKAYKTTTDDFGKYAFTVPPGKYMLYYRHAGKVKWTVADCTPLFSQYKPVKLPLIVREGEPLSINDINTIKERDLQIIFPKPRQKLLPCPTFEWQKYPSADVYGVWIYVTMYDKSVPYSYPVAYGKKTRATNYTLDSPLPVSDDYDIWVIAYNWNEHELADGKVNFGVEEE